jgi:hypothetical protein
MNRSQTKEIVNLIDYQNEDITNEIIKFYEQTDEAFKNIFSLSDIDYGEKLTPGERSGFISWNELGLNGELRATTRFIICTDSREAASKVGLVYLPNIKSRVESMNTYIDRCNVLRTSKLKIEGSIVFGIAQQTHSRDWITEFVFDIFSFWGF